MRAVQTLNTDLATLDSEYNKLTDCMAQGERDGFDQKWLIGMWAHVQRMDSDYQFPALRALLHPSILFM